MCSEWFYSGWYWIGGLRRVHLCLFAPALHVSETLRIWFGCKVTPYFGARTSIIEVQLIFTPLRGGRPHWDQRFARLSSSHGHVVLGVPKPTVLQHVCISIQKKHWHLCSFGVKCKKWAKLTGASAGLKILQDASMCLKCAVGHYFHLGTVFATTNLWREMWTACQTKGGLVSTWRPTANPFGQCTWPDFVGHASSIHVMG